MKSTLTSTSLSFKPSKHLNQYITSTKFTSKKNLKEVTSVLTDEDRDFIKTLKLTDVGLDCKVDTVPTSKGKRLSLQDLLQIWTKLDHEDGTYLHELLLNTEVILPQNPEVPRSEVLDKRCKLLQMQQENREYKNMTKNVDSVRKMLPEDTIAYQLKEMNRQLIAVLQFVISIVVGFVFGFIGIEMMIGPLDVGFRLLLGIISSLVIGLAELYFLAKKLSE